MASSGHELLKDLASPDQTAANSSLRRWLEANVEVLRARSGLALARQGQHTRVLDLLPENHLTQPVLLRTATIALDKGVIVERVREGDDVTAFIGIQIRLGGRPGAVAFCLPVENDASDSEIALFVRSKVLRRVDDNTPPSEAPLDAAHAAVFESNLLSTAAPSSETSALVHEQGAVIDVLAAMLDQDSLGKSARALVDAVARHFACQRVGLGNKTGRRVAIDAVSGSAEFDTASPLAADLIAAMEETLAQESVVSFAHDNPPAVPVPAHARLATSSHVRNVASLPLVHADKVVGALVLERDEAFSEQELEQVRALILLASPVIALYRENGRGPLKRVADSARGALGRVLGFDHFMFKLVALCVAGFLFWSANTTRVFHINADAAIEATVQRAIVAGSNSYLAQVEKRPGDVVYQGDVLARLDIEELQLERIRWEGERDKLVKEQRATLAQRDRTRVRILSAKHAQAQTQIDYLDAQISRAVLRAPIDGVVISGDLMEALGSPVERGQVLYEVASLSSYRLVLMVDEADVGEVDEGYQGRLRLRSRPHETFEFVVTGITPVSQSANGANEFRLEAQLIDAPEQLRPGMGGIAKIDAGDKAIGWIWTRSFVNWARLQLWKLGSI